VSGALRQSTTFISIHALAYGRLKNADTLVTQASGTPALTSFGERTVNSFKARLNRMVHAFPRSINWYASEAAALAQINQKATAFIKANPQPRAVF
jgi:hypothetical protein